MKRLTAFFLSVMLLISSGTLVGFSEESESASSAVSVKYALDANFNTDATGSKPTGFSEVIRTNSDEITVAEVPDSNNKSIKFASSSFKEMCLHQVIPDDFGRNQENIIIKFKLMFERLGTSSAYFKLYTYNTFEKTSYTVDFIKTDVNGNVLTGGGTPLFRAMPGKFYDISLNINYETKSMDVYSNHKRVADDVFIQNEFSYLPWLRFYMAGFSDELENPVLHIDDVQIYKAPEPVFVLKNMGIEIIEEGSSNLITGDVEKFMNGITAFYINRPTVAVGGVIENFDEDEDGLMTISEGGVAYAPVSALSNIMKFDYEDGGDYVKFTADNKELVFYYDGKGCTLNGEKYSDAFCNLKGEYIYAPIKTFAEAFGKKYFEHKSGLIMVGDNADKFKFDESDIGVFRQLTYNMCFEAPSADDVAEDIAAANLTHPRILLNSKLLTELKNNIANNATIASWYQNIKKQAYTVMMEKPVLSYSLTTGSPGTLLGVAQEARNRIPNLALVYLVEGDESYAKRAKEEMLSIASFKDWHPWHGLDTGELNRAMGIGYDWLYNYLTPDERTSIKNAIAKNGLQAVMEDYTNKFTYVKDGSSQPRSAYWATLTDAPHNWLFVCNSGALVAAMSVADEEAELSANVIHYASENLAKAIRFLAPDGTWDEGPMYEPWMLVCLTSALSSMDNTLGTTYGLFEMPGVKHFPYSINDYISSKMIFNFGNCDNLIGNANANGTYYIASKTNDLELANTRSYAVFTNDYKPGYMDLIYAKPEYLEIKESTTNFAKHSKPGAYEYATFRQEPTSLDSINLAFTVNKNIKLGNGAENGSFMLDAYGTRYAVDPGKPDYSGTRSEKYRARAEGNNTIVINPDLTAGQKLDSLGKISSFEYNKSSAYAVLDLCDVYSENAKNAYRAFKMTDNKERIIVQDEIKSDKPMDFWWFMHTGCKIELSEDGKTAILKGDKKNLRMRLVESTGTAKFEIRDPKFLETSPQTDKSVEINMQKLAVHMENALEVNMMVVFDFEYPYVDQIKELPQMITIDKWTLDTEAASAPKLTSIELNGSLVEGFSPDTDYYKYIVKDGEALPAVTASSEGKVEIIPCDKIPGTTLINVTDDKGVSRQYGVVFEYKFNKVLGEPLNPNRKGLPIYDVEVSQILEAQNIPANMLDGDLGTRWVGSGEQYIVFDLSKSIPISSVGIAIYSASTDGRQQKFDILLSEDGENFITVLEDARTSGTTDDEENIAFTKTNARYVKIQFYGNTVNDYDSITEVNIYE